MRNEVSRDIREEVEVGGLPIVCHFGGDVLLQRRSRMESEEIIKGCASCRKRSRRWHDAEG